MNASRMCCQSSLNCLCFVEHDVFLGGLAEWEVGAGRGFTHVLYVAIGTGIAASLLSTSGHWRGAAHMAGEIGQINDQTGAGLETVASAGAIGAEYSLLMGRPCTAEDAAREVGTKGQASVVWGRAMSALVSVVGSCVTLLDPDAVVVGGGLSLAGSRLLDPLEDGLSRTSPEFRRAPAVRGAELGRFAGCHGAALYAGTSIGQAKSPS